MDAKLQKQAARVNNFKAWKAVHEVAQEVVIFRREPGRSMVSGFNHT